MNVDMDDDTQSSKWNEQLSQNFIDYGQYFVPDRDEQIRVIVELLPESIAPYTVIELCCGEGLLAEAILERYPHCQIWGYDGSHQMLIKASSRLRRFGDRFLPMTFNLADYSWRNQVENIQAIVTSLALHHLPGSEKAKLFSDVYHMLVPGGVFIIADIIDPKHPRGRTLAATSYDVAVRDRSLELDGSLDGFEFFQREGWNIFHYLDPEDIDKPSPLYDQLKWLGIAGFICIDVFWMRAGHAIFGGWRGEENGSK